MRDTLTFIVQALIALLVMGAGLFLAVKNNDANFILGLATAIIGYYFGSLAVKRDTATTPTPPADSRTISNEK